MSENFKEYLSKRGLGPSTEETYYGIIYQFYKRYGRIEGDELYNAFQEFVMLNVDGTKRRNKTTVVFALKMYAKYLGQKDLFEMWYDENRKAINSKMTINRVVLSKEDVKKLIGMLPEPYDLIALLQYDTLLRASALLNMRTSDVIIDGKRVIIKVVEKGGEQITRYLSPFASK